MTGISQRIHCHALPDGRLLVVPIPVPADLNAIRANLPHIERAVAILRAC